MEEEGDVWDYRDFYLLSVFMQEIKLFGPTILPLSTGDKSEHRKPENEVGNAAKIHIVL